MQAYDKNGEIKSSIESRWDYENKRIKKDRNEKQNRAKRNDRDIKPDKRERLNTFLPYRRCYCTNGFDTRNGCSEAAVITLTGRLVLAACRK